MIHATHAYHETVLTGWPLQRLAIPFAELGRRLIGFLEKAEKERVGIARLAHGVIGQNELPKIVVVKAASRLQARRAVTGRLRIGIDIECGAAIAAITGPEAAA